MALNLVNYSDSDSESSDGRSSKRLRTTTALSPGKISQPSSSVPMDLPPLPSRFHDLYVAAPRLAIRDDPSLHGGRQRVVPHEVGNWPTFVFLEWHLNTNEFSLLSEIINRCNKIIAGHERQKLGLPARGQDEGSDEDKDTIPPASKEHIWLDGKRKSRHSKNGTDLGKPSFKLISSLVSELGSELPLHLSLSRPNTLKTDERAGFVDLLGERIRKAKIKPFDVLFTGFEWVGNAEGTRWFFVMTAKSKDTELSTLLQLTNLTFAAYRQPSLYTPSKPESGFHVTIAWSLEAPDPESKKQLENDITKEFQTRLTQLTMKVEEVKMKIGNAVKVLPLLGGVVS